MGDTAFLDMIDFMRNFIALREQDGGFMPVCSCGADMGTGGAIIRDRSGEQWLARCPVCLANEPLDDVPRYNPAEVIALTLAKYGKRVSAQPEGGGDWSLEWSNKESS